jgi:Mg-chelatase subunit ChlD
MSPGISLGRVTWLTLALAACIAAAAPAFAAADPNSPADEAALRSDVARLKIQVELQRAQIEALTQKIEQFEAKLGGGTRLPTAVTPQPPAPAAGQAAPAIAQAQAGATRVVFVVDTSGSMIDKFKTVKEFVLSAVDVLPTGASFNVVVASDNRTHSFRPQPIARTPAARADLVQALDDLTTNGTTNLMPAIEIAVRQRADLVWLVTDGDMPNNAEFLARLRTVNTRPARINTVAAVTSAWDATAESFVRFMTSVASQHRGTSHVLDPRGGFRSTAAPARPVPQPQQPAQPAGPVPAPIAASAKRTVIFVIDSSASMAERFDAVKAEVRKAVGGFAADTSFNVVVAHRQQADQFRSAAVPAEPANVAEAQGFIDRLKPSPAADDNVLFGIDVGLRQRPDTLWVITDASVSSPANRDMLARVRAASAAGRTRINAVVAADTKQEVPPEMAAFIKVLADLTSAQGGRCIDLAGAPIDPAGLKVKTSTGAGGVPAQGAGQTKPDAPKRPAALFDDH